MSNSQNFTEAPKIERKFSVMSETALINLDNIEMSLDRFTKAMLTIDEQFNTLEDGRFLYFYNF
jgi:hypothetical protein